MSKKGMKIVANRNINKTEVYHQKSTQSRSPSTPIEVHAIPEIHSIKSSDKSTKGAVTMLHVAQ